MCLHLHACSLRVETCGSASQQAAAHPAQQHRHVSHDSQPHGDACGVPSSRKRACELPPTWPSSTEMTVITASAPKVPANTIPLGCLSASSSAMKKVLSPISLNKMSRKPETNPSRRGESPTMPAAGGKVVGQVARGTCGVRNGVGRAAGVCEGRAGDAGALMVQNAVGGVSPVAVNLHSCFVCAPRVHQCPSLLMPSHGLLHMGCCTLDSAQSM